MRQSLLTLLLFLNGLALLAQVNPGYTTFSAVVQGNPLVSSTTLGYNLNFSVTSKANHIGSTLPVLREKNRSAKLYMRLDLGNDYAKAASGWNFKVSADITYSFGSSTSGITKSIRITDKNPEFLWVEDVSSSFTTLSPSCHVNIVIDSINDGAPAPAALTGLVNSLVTSSLRFTAKLVREYDVDVRLSSNLFMSDALSINAPVVNGRFATFSWKPNTGAGIFDNYPNYQLQILKLENTDTANIRYPERITAQPDWSNALTVETQSYKNTIDLTIGEGTGFYLWRVRPIGTYYAGGIGNSENYGQWSYADSIITGLEKNTLLPLSHALPFAFYVTDPDENMNWIYNRVFTEGDDYDKENPTGSKISEGMSYADGLQRVRQSQKYNSADHTTIASQMVNDYSGRPAVSTIPVPTKGGLTGYKPGFVKNRSNKLYTAADFDTDSTLHNPGQIQDSLSAFSYYSGNPSAPGDIDNSFVPDAQGYSFKRTLYKTDGTNRVEEESGVGRTHAPGSQANGMGRTTRVIYGVPSEDELIQIFGLEAPLATSVIKTTTIDQNNVISVSYTSKEGKTIATALSSTATANLGPLAATHSLEVLNSVNDNVYLYGRIVATKRIGITADDTKVNLTYTAKNIPGSTGACTTGDCNYKLRLYMTDLTTNKTYVSDENLGIPGNSFFSVTDTVLTFPASWGFVNIIDTNLILTPTGPSHNELSLNTGEYIFTKELFSTNDPGYAQSRVNVDGDKVSLIMDAIARKMQDISTPAKKDSFDLFIHDFSQAVATYTASHTTTDSDNAWLILGITPSTETGLFPTGFDILPLAPVSGDATNSSLQVKTSCCGVMSVQVPNKSVCIVCDGISAGTNTSNPSIAGMKGTNDLADPDATTPYGLKDFEANSNWNGLVVADKRDALYSLVAREFIIPLKNKMLEEGINDLWKIAPGFTFESLNFMISNMLISHYYTGSSITNTASMTNYAYTIDTAGAYINGDVLYNNVGTQDSLYPHNYDCKKLLEAWTGAVALLNSFELEGNDNNMFKAYDDEQGPSAALNEILNVDNWAPALRTTIHAMENFFTSLINRLKTSRAGNLPSSKLDALTSLPGNFMTFAGYQFAAVIDGKPLPTHISKTNDIIPDDYSDFLFAAAPTGDPQIYTAIDIGTMHHDYVPLVFDGQGTVTTSQCNGTNYQELYYPYILKPEWMFKYFVYNVYNDAVINDSDLVIPQQVMADIALNYNEPVTYLLSPPSSELCYPSVIYPISNSSDTFAYTHYSWSCDERYTFYNRISLSPACPKEKGVLDPAGDATGEIYTGGTVPQWRKKSELLDEAKAELASTVQTLNNRAAIIKTALTNELINACYRIVPCKSAPALADEITDKDIDLMVNVVIAKSLEPVVAMQAIFNNITESDRSGCTSAITSTVYSNNVCDLPACSYTDCQEIIYYESNRLGLKSSRNFTVKYFNDCDLKLLDMLLTGTFIPDIDPPSNVAHCSKAQKEWKSCHTETNCDANGRYAEKENCPSSEFINYSKEYSVTADRN